MFLPSSSTDAILESVYRWLKDPDKTEQMTIEQKAFALTQTTISKSSIARKLAETIAAVANCGEDFAYIVCISPAPPTEPIVDPAILDDLICRHVHPRIVLALRRLTIEREVIDFIIIPKSTLRPHLVQLDDSRFIVPIRGLANNSTAARSQLDQMYQEHTVELLRRAFPQVTLGETNPIGKYLEDIGYGLAAIDRPQYSLTIAPDTIPSRIIPHDQLFGDLHLQRDLYRNLVIPAVNLNHKRFQFWFNIDLFTNYDEGEDYFEMNQTTPADAGFRCAARIYDTGTVTYSHPFQTQCISEGKYAFSPYAAESYWAATLAFTSLVLRRFEIAATSFFVRLAYKNAQDILIGRQRVRGESVAEFSSMRNPMPLILLPAREPLRVTRAELERDWYSITQQLMRSVNAAYQPLLQETSTKLG